MTILLSCFISVGAQGRPEQRVGTAGGESTTPSAVRLETVELTSEVFGNTRLLRILLPSGYDEAPVRRYPVLYLLDGQTLFDASDSYTEHVWEVDEAMADLLEERAIEPLIVVGIDNPGLRERANELLPWHDEYLSPPLPDPQGRRFPQFLVEEVMPLVELHYRVLQGAEHTGIGGASYAGLMALYTVIHRPGVFGKVLIESPGFYVNGAAILDEAEAFDDWPEKIYVGVGTNEEGRDECREDDMGSEAVQDVLRLQAILERSGLPRERRHLQVAICAQHDERAYGSRFPGALRFLYGSTSNAQTESPPPRPSHQREATPLTLLRRRRR